MNRAIDCKCGFAIFFMVVLLQFLPTSVHALPVGTVTQDINRVNLVFVMDASNSMNYTDHEGLRYQAIERFAGRMTEKGNYMGGVVFSNHVVEIDGIELQPVNSSTEKKAITDRLGSWMSQGVNEDAGYTNIGEALSAAVDVLASNGSPDLPSYIVFLSDGNTEMPSKEELEESRESKTEAVNKAVEKQIKIFSICLNENGRADIGEMKDFSQRTGGEFQEVIDAADLSGACDVFESMITGFEIKSQGVVQFPADGKLETTFDVPTLGAEEVNITIDGPAKGVALKNPGHDYVDCQSYVFTSRDTFMQMKIPTPLPGCWILETSGVPGDSIEIKIQYNSNLVVDAAVEPESAAAGESFIISAVLKAGDITASTDEDYAGYHAQAQIKDAFGNVCGNFPMEVRDGRFTTSCRLDNGIYYVVVHVTTDYEFTADSADIGPVRVGNSAGSSAPTAPVPVKNPITKTVYILPGRDTSLTIDMNDLAQDSSGELRYTVINTVFIENTDFTVDDNGILTMNNFSLLRGFFDIRATNASGLSCDIKVNVNCIHIGYMALIGITLVGLIALIAFLVLLRYLLQIPFRGDITVYAYLQGFNGPKSGSTQIPKRGRCKLSAFHMDPVGLDYNKCYFQASGDRYITLRTNTPVIYNGKKTKEVLIPNQADIELMIRDSDPNRRLKIRFQSHIKNNVKKVKKKTSKRHSLSGK